MPGPIQALALEAVARCDSGVGATDNQKSSLLRALVDAALQGADVNLIAAAAKALPTLPVDVAAFVVELVSGEYDAGRNVSSEFLVMAVPRSFGFCQGLDVGHMKF